MAEKWDGSERRRSDSTIIEPLLNHLDHRFDHLDTLIDNRFDEMDTRIKSAYPDGDPVKHRLEHESRMKFAESWSNLKQSVAEAMVKAGVIGAVGLLLASSWDSFVEFIRRLK